MSGGREYLAGNEEEGGAQGQDWRESDGLGKSVVRRRKPGPRIRIGEGLGSWRCPVCEGGGAGAKGVD